MLVLKILLVIVVIVLLLLLLLQFVVFCSFTYKKLRRFFAKPVTKIYITATIGKWSMYEKITMKADEIVHVEDSTKEEYIKQERRN